MANPYIVGSPVLYSQLYGRDELIEKCYADVNNNIWLLGRRRSGKTSVLCAIKEFALEKKEWFPVYVTLEDCFSDDDIKKSFLRDFRDNLEKFDIEDKYQPPDGEQDFADSVDDICRWLNERDIGLLLLIDEIERIEDLGGEGSRLEAKLRGVLGRREPRLRMIIAASRVLRTRKKVVTSPFINLFRPEYLGAISKEEARKLIRQEKNPEIKIQVADEVMDEILEKTGSEPYLIQYLCHRLYNEDNSLRIPTDEDLNQPDIGLKLIFENDYQFLERDEQYILNRIAQGHQISSASIPVELIRLGYIKKVNNHYRIGNHFLETWLQIKVVRELSPLDESSEEYDLSATDNKLLKQFYRLVDIFIIIFGLGLLLFEFAVLRHILNPLQVTIVLLATVILGAAILIFAGRYTDIIGETIFYKLLSRVVKNIQK
ncbi:ATP-binding protein [Candidatus Poribacteria bacterium]|nr:ATP-binding protein [Candidatus Poribacteria bacterium]